MLDLLCCVAAVGIHLGSVHVDQNEWLKANKPNNVNPGVYVEFDSGLTLGTYRNTNRDQSAYVAYTHHFGKVGPLLPSVAVGIVSGYRDGLKPMIVPSIALEVHPHIRPRLSYAPKIDSGAARTGAHIFHLSVEYRF